MNNLFLWKFFFSCILYIYTRILYPTAYNTLMFKSFIWGQPPVWSDYPSKKSEKSSSSLTHSYIFWLCLVRRSSTVLVVIYYKTFRISSIIFLTFLYVALWSLVVVLLICKVKKEYSPIFTKRSYLISSLNNGWVFCFGLCSFDMLSRYICYLQTYQNPLKDNPAYSVVK